jgi:predicted CoA-substrate-specific enzyme activase
MTLYGFDVGSRTAKCFNNETGEVLMEDSHNWREIIPERGDIISTGYFRKKVPNIFNVTEITSAIYGASYLLGEEGLDVIVDIGGQDTKVIDVSTNEFRMNDRCSAGTGTFLEFMAEYLGIDLMDLEKCHFQAKKSASINSTCSVFAHTEAISRLVEGCSKDEVVNGIHLAFARRIAQMIPNDCNSLALIGGTAKNKGVVDAFSQILEMEIVVPEDPQIVNAVGAVQYYKNRILQI